MSASGSACDCNPWCWTALGGRRTNPPVRPSFEARPPEVQRPTSAKADSGRRGRPPPFSRFHPAAHKSGTSRRAPSAGDKGLGRNGMPKPAGAGGGSWSSLSLERFGGPTRLNHLETTLCLRPEGGRWARYAMGASSSSRTSARRMSSTSTTAPLSSRRSEGAFSTARASEIHDARIALFSAMVSFGSLVTSPGCV